MGFRLIVVLVVTATLAAASCRRAPTGPIELAVPGGTGAHVTVAAEGDRVGADVFVAWTDQSDQQSTIRALRVQ